MARTSLFALVFCLAWSSGVFSPAAKAEPKVLTAVELAAVTSGRMAPPIQINTNTTTQVARATAISIATCAACANATVTASSSATALNTNLAEVTNAF
jgi:hypothetical protein